MTDAASLPKKRKPINGRWWALIDERHRRIDAMPCLFHSREAARVNREPTERIIRVHVKEVNR